MNLENTQVENKLEVTDIIKSALLETAKWTKFLAILGFVGIGLMIVAAFFMGVVMSSVNSFNDYGTSTNAFDFIGTGVISIIYIVMAVLYFFPVKYLFDFSNKVKTALQIQDQLLFNEAFTKLKSHYKFIGILTIVMIALYILIILGTIIFAVIMAGSL